ncbi:MAG: protein kinase, partial [Gammaproteobacteria bacterium]
MQSFYTEAQGTIDKFNEQVNELLFPDKAKIEAKNALNTALLKASIEKDEDLLTTCRDTVIELRNHYQPPEKRNLNTKLLISTLEQLIRKRREGQLELASEKRAREKREAEEKAKQTRIEAERKAREAAELAEKTRIEAEKKAQEEKERAEKARIEAERERLRIEQERREAEERAERESWRFSNILGQINTNATNPILEIAKIRTEASTNANTTLPSYAISKNELQTILEALKVNSSVQTLNLSNIGIIGLEFLLLTLANLRRNLTFIPDLQSIPNPSIGVLLKQMPPPPNNPAPNVGKILEQVPQPPKPPVRILPDISSSWIIREKDINIIREIKKGGFGSVNYGIWENTPIAVKIPLPPFSLTSEASKASINEAKVLARLHHPNIVRLYGICKFSDHYNLVLEYMPKGSLYQVLHSTETLTWTVRWEMATEISRGMRKLHESKPCIVHRDFKSHNVLIDKDNHAKISDFGSAAFLDENSTEKPACTLAWKAPELLQASTPAPYTPKSDIYSLGVTFCEIASRNDPWVMKAPKQSVAAEVCNGRRDNIPADTPPSYAALIKRCWADRATERPDIREVVQILEDHKSE